MKHSWRVVSFVSVLALLATFFLYITFSQYNPTTKLANEAFTDAYQLNHHQCKFTIPKDMRVDCATLITPKVSGYFQLPVAIIRYDGPDKRKDPVFYLQGGPGVKAGMDTYGIEGWQYFIDGAALKRDLIIMDRRGVGGSKPALTCVNFDKFSEEVLRENLTVKQEVMKGNKVLAQCFNDTINFNIKHYGTQENANDLEALIRHLDYPRWNLVGVSYGTRLALELISRNKNNITKNLNALVLDSVYPAEVGSFNEWPKILTDAVDGFYQACGSSAACNKRWLELKANFTATTLPKALAHVLSMLKRQPIKLTVTRYNALPVDVVVNDALFLSAMFSASYNHTLWPEIIAALNAVQVQDRKVLQEFIGDFIQHALSDSVSSLAFIAVDCQDNPMGSKDAYNRNVTHAGILAPYVENLWALQICHQWPATQKALTLNTRGLIQFKVPTLLLAGEYDPITPKAWAYELSKLLPNVQLDVFENTGHAVLWSGDCALEGLGRYLDSPEESWQACRDG